MLFVYDVGMWSWYFLFVFAVCICVSLLAEEEIRESYKNSGSEIDEEELQALMGEADANGDGMISFEGN